MENVLSVLWSWYPINIKMIIQVLVGYSSCVLVISQENTRLAWRQWRPPDSGPYPMILALSLLFSPIKVFLAVLATLRTRGRRWWRASCWSFLEVVTQGHQLQSRSDTLPAVLRRSLSLPIVEKWACRRWKTSFYPLQDAIMPKARARSYCGCRSIVVGACRVKQIRILNRIDQAFRLASHFPLPLPLLQF